MIHCQMCQDFEGKAVTSDGLILCEAHMDAYRDGQLNPDAIITPYEAKDYDCMYCYQRDANAHILIMALDADDPLMVCGACTAAFVQGQSHPSSTLSSVIGFSADGKTRDQYDFPQWLITSVTDEHGIQHALPESYPIAEATL